MPKIPISTRPATEVGRLYPRYISESDLIEISSATFAGQSPFGFSYGGDAIFDLDENWVVVYVEVLIDRSMWSVPSALPSIPESSGHYDLIIDQSSLDIQGAEVSGTAKVFGDQSKSNLLISFTGGMPNAKEVITLSDCCYAMITDKRLEAFYLEL